MLISCSTNTQSLFLESSYCIPEATEALKCFLIIENQPTNQEQTLSYKYILQCGLPWKKQSCFINIYGY